MTDKDIFEMQARLVETYQEMDKLAKYFKKVKVQVILWLWVVC